MIFSEVGHGDDCEGIMCICKVVVNGFCKQVPMKSVAGSKLRVSTVLVAVSV